MLRSFVAKGLRDESRLFFNGPIRVLLWQVYKPLAINSFILRYIVRTDIFENLGFMKSLEFCSPGFLKDVI